MIRALTRADQGAYDAFLVRGLAAHPERFRITPDDVRASPLPVLGPGVDDFTLAAFAPDGTLLGVASFTREPLLRLRHKGWLVRMYVAAAAAGHGLGRALLRGVVARAKRLKGLEQINLTVVATNQRARRLYLSEGFLPFAREPRALKHGDHYEDEEQMSLRLAD